MKAQGGRESGGSGSAADNVAARQLYDRLGFGVVLTRQEYYGPGRAALVMERATPGVVP